MAVGELRSYFVFTPPPASLRRFYLTLCANGLTSDPSGHIHTGINLARIIEAGMVERGSASRRDRECSRGTRNVDWSGTRES